MGTTTADQKAYEMATGPESMHLDSLAFAGAAAAVAAAVMLLLSIFAALGVYAGAVEMMVQWHMFYQPTITGTVTGMVEAAVISFVLVYPLTWLYNISAR